MATFGTESILHFRATKMMTSRLSQLLQDYLTLCGLHRSKIDGCDSGTKLFHDLGIYGEVAEACMEELVDSYQVDLTNFDFEKYFPLEFPGKTGLSRFLLWQIPFAKRFAERKAEYEPLTLEMIEVAIQTKQWPPSGDHRPP